MDVHAGAGQVGGHHVRHRVGGGSGRAVGDEPSAAHRLLVDADVHHGAVPGSDHVGHDRAGDEEVAGHVGGHQVGEPRRADIVERSWLGEEPGIDRPHADAGVVDQDVDAAEGRARGRHAVGDGGLVPHVHRDPGGRSRAGGRLLLGDPAGTVGVPAGQDHRGPAGHQGPHHAQPQPAGTARQQDPDAADIGVSRLPLDRPLGHELLRRSVPRSPDLP
ncbi:hypothetical protein UXQ13_09475 [Klenkia terrae]|uniref:Uncharacterized protein n=1 Tax=Klenkia terrae TaxID=1052259 RepID=A0ABU8E4X3_9ACTN|nr:hypothetical protein [Klenkia terrae]